VFARFSPEDFSGADITPAGWTPRDVMFHIGAWMAEAAMQMERMRAGTFHGAGDIEGETIERMNREWFEISRDLDTPTVRAELFASRTMMMQAWEALPEITAIAWEWFEESGPRHYDEHLPDLRAWLDRAS
jgi:hypothetical protein